MSHSVKKTVSEMGFDALSDRLNKSSLDFEDNVNKPDFRQLDLGSPVSPLRVQPTTTTSSSSSSSGSGSLSGRPNSTPRKPGSNLTTATKTHSGELSVESSPTFRSDKTGSGSRCALNSDPGHARPGNGTSSVSSPPPPANVLPTGNICPSGKVLKTGMSANRSSKTDVLGSGLRNYGHGSIMRGGGAALKESPTRVSGRPETSSEDLKRMGNEQYKKGNFFEALCLYDKAIGLSPANASYHCNRAAALVGLNRLDEAVKECEQAIRLDSGYVRAHQRLGSILLSLGQVESAKRQLCCSGYQPDPIELQKLQALEKHLRACTDARNTKKSWNIALSECDSAIAAGANASPQLFACRAEAYLQLGQLEKADKIISEVPKFDAFNLPCSKAKFFGMLPEAYLLFVRAKIDLALGRFENAVNAVKKAAEIDAQNAEISFLLHNARFVARARDRGNELFKSERITEACSAYGDGLRHDPSNSVLLCNRAACWFKLGQWEKSLDDCNQALRIHPSYQKALLRRAASYSKLERWDESVKDYEVLNRQLPGDKDIAESLFHAQIALKISHGEEVCNVKFGGEVESVMGLEQFRAAISSTGASIVHFKSASGVRCEETCLFVATLCTRYPSINFLKVDVQESPLIASAENVRMVPTFKIYKNGKRLKEMICPSQEALEASVKHYSL